MRKLLLAMCLLVLPFTASANIKTACFDNHNHGVSVSYQVHMAAKDKKIWQWEWEASAEPRRCIDLFALPAVKYGHQVKFFVRIHWHHKGKKVLCKSGNIDRWYPHERGGKLLMEVVGSNMWNVGCQVLILEKSKV